MPSRVSVIIPVHNGAGYLRTCLAALQRSTAANWECIVVDDGSTDGSSDVAQTYGARTICLSERGESAHARNIGVEHATGDVLFFVDADVRVHPDTIERVQRAFDDDPALDALIGSYDDQPASRDFLSQYRNLLHCFFHQTAQEKASTFWTGCGAIRRDVFIEAGGFNERRSIADIELGYKLTEAGRNIRLDRELRVTHLKRWTFWSIVKTDIFVRGIPWVDLILSYRHLPNDLNVRAEQRLSVVFLYVALGLLALMPFAPVAAGVGALVAVAFVLALNRSFYRFLARSKGIVFAIRAVPMHLLYHLYNGLSFAVGVARYALRSRTLGRSAALWVMCACLASAADHWSQFKSGPFQILTTEGDKPARSILNDLEQMRYALGKMIGKEDLKSVWPMRFVIVKPGRGDVFPVPKLARDAMVASLSELTPAAREAVITELLESNAGRMPRNVEHGLVELFSTFSSDGPRISVGAPSAQRDRDWARMHMLVLDPRFSGKVRVLLYNLQQGVEPGPAYSNAFNMTPEQVEHEVDAYMRGRLEAGSLSGRPLDPRRELLAWDVDPQVGELARADVLVANGKSDESAYAKFPGALDAPVPLLERARKEKDPAKARALYEQAAKLNPAWADPVWLEAQIETNPARKVQLMKNATQLAPRHADYWVALARAQEAAGQFNDAVKTWVSAERAAAKPEDRARITEMRIAGERQRQEQAQAEREAEERAKRAELEALRQKSLEGIRAAEARANAGNAPRDPNEKLDWYRENAGYGKLAGRLLRVDCIGRQSVLHVTAEAGKAVKLLIADPGKVAIGGGGKHALSCGVQRPARGVTIEYIEKNNAKLGTAGEVTTIEFR